jgi:hypothetical protein
MHMGIIGSSAQHNLRSTILTPSIDYGHWLRGSWKISTWDAEGGSMLVKQATRAHRVVNRMRHASTEAGREQGAAALRSIAHDW